MKPTNFIIPFFLLSLMFQSGCVRLDKRQQLSGDGHIVSSKRATEPFHSISSTGDLSLMFRQSNRCGVTVTVDENLQDYVYTEVIDGVLTIGTPDNCRLNGSKTLLVEIDYVDLSRLDLAGAVKLRNDRILSFDTLHVVCAGASDFDWHISGNSLDVHIPGASVMKLSGRVDRVRMQLDGTSSVDATALNVAVFSLNMAGASKVNLLATKQLDVDLAGAGYVNYKGNPAVKNFSINGFGRVVPNVSN